MKVCEKCKTENADSTMYCTTCGTQLPIQPAQPTPPVQSTPATAFAAPMAKPASGKKMDGKTLGLIAVAVIGLIIGIVGIVMAITSGNQKTETPTPAPAPVVEESSETSDILGNSVGTVVKIGPYITIIPREYPFELKENNIILSDPTNSAWAVNIIYDESIAYSQVSSNLKKLGEYYTSQGAKNVKTGTAKTGDLNYLYVDMVDDGFAKTLAIFKADSNIFEVIISDGSANPNHNIIDTIAPIIANVKKGETAARDLGFTVTTKGVDILKLDGAFDGFESSEE